MLLPMLQLDVLVHGEYLVRNLRLSKQKGIRASYDLRRASCAN